MDLKNVLETAINEHFIGSDKFLIELKISNTYDISVVFDGDKSSSLKDCEALSKMVKEVLHQNGLEDYSLEVGTHGLGSPLILWRQYEKFINREVEVLMKNGEVFKGILQSAIENESLTISRVLSKTRIKKGESPSLLLLLSEIKSTKAVIQFK